jgi:hypothetical protein
MEKCTRNFGKKTAGSGHSKDLKEEGTIILTHISQENKLLGRKFDGTGSGPCPVANICNRGICIMLPELVT